MAKKTARKTTKKKTATGSINKAEEIRKEIKKQGIDSRTKDIAEALAKRGIKVPSSAVSIEKSKLRGGPQKRTTVKKRKPNVDVFDNAINLDEERIRQLCFEVYGEQTRAILRASKGDYDKAKQILKML